MIWACIVLGILAGMRAVASGTDTIIGVLGAKPNPRNPARAQMPQQPATETKTCVVNGSLRAQRASETRMETPMKLIAMPAMALVTLVAALPAWSEGGPMGGRSAMMMEDFDAIDADKDAKVTEAEIAAYRAARFAAADADKDGLLSAEELAAMHQAQEQTRLAQRTAKMIEHLDADSDGLLSADELAAMSERKTPFERADADNDGAITKAEIEAAMEEHGDNRHGHGKGRGHGKGWWGGN